jgi:hypothetical protein
VIGVAELVVMAIVLLVVGLTTRSLVWGVAGVVLFVVLATAGLFAFRAITGGRPAVRRLAHTYSVVYGGTFRRFFRGKSN